MKFNKTIVSLSVMLLLTATIVGVGFTKGTAYNMDFATKLAASYVPYSSQPAGASELSDRFNLRYTDQTQIYEVAVDKVHGKVVSMKTIYTANKAGSTASLNENNIREIIQHSTPDAAIQSVTLETANDQPVYEAIYDTSTSHTIAHLSASTGNTLDRTVEYTDIAPYTS